MVRGVRMLCPAWLLALAVLCAGGSEVRAQCWENTRCRDLTTEESILVSDNIPCTTAFQFTNSNFAVDTSYSLLVVLAEANITIANT